MRTLFLKLPIYLLAAFCLLGLGGLIFIGQRILAAELSIERLAPQPERFTQLYFTHHQQLPTWLQPKTQKVVFTIFNAEHRSTNYAYSVNVKSDNFKQKLGGGSIALRHGQKKDITQQITLPDLRGRLKVEVVLQYQALRPSQAVPVAVWQSVHYWLISKEASDAA